MKKTYIHPSAQVVRLKTADVITTSVGTNGLSGFGGFGGSTGGAQADAPGRKSIWE